MANDETISKPKRQAEKNEIVLWLAHVMSLDRGYDSQKPRIPLKM